VTSEPIRGRRAQKRSMKPFYIALALIAVVGGGLIAMTVLKPEPTAATAASTALQPITTPSELMVKARGVTRGNPNAPVKLMVFSDYMCPWCAVYATTIANQVRTTFLDTGKAVEIYYDFPLGGTHVHSFLAARAARCAEEQNKFWEYHDVLFNKQRDWSFEEAPPVKTFIGYAEDLSLDKKQFAACFQSDKHSDLVEWNRQLGEQAGVNSTPTIFINGRRSQAPLDFEKFKAEIEAAGAGR
jgi:protein-disulfide isomerase